MGMLAQVSTSDRVPWFWDAASCPRTPVRPCATQEALDEVLPPACSKMMPASPPGGKLGQKSKTKGGVKQKLANFVDMKTALDSGKLSHERFFRDARTMLSSGKLTEEQKIVMKAMMKQDIGRRMEQVMADAIQGGSQFVGSPLRAEVDFGPDVVMGQESMMSSKGPLTGSSQVPLQEQLRWKCDRKIAERICNFNRKAAEPSGYFATVGGFMSEATACTKSKEDMSFHDSNSGQLLFTARSGRDFEGFLKESTAHGWPSFRDAQVNWSFVRVLEDGEAISINGTHLGHNLPDKHGNRYCINLVSVAGHPN